MNSKLNQTYPVPAQFPSPEITAMEEDILTSEFNLLSEWGKWSLRIPATGTKLLEVRGERRLNKNEFLSFGNVKLLKCLRDANGQ